jgi:hypothetical protein
VTDMFCDWCGWLRQHCPCQPDTAEARAAVEARHAAAARLAAQRSAQMAAIDRQRRLLVRLADTRRSRAA